MVYLDIALPPIGADRFISLVRQSTLTVLDTAKRPFEKLKVHHKTQIGSHFQDSMREQYPGFDWVHIKYTSNDTWIIPPACIGKPTLLARGDVRKQVCSLELAVIPEDVFRKKDKHYLSQKKLHRLGITQTIVPETSWTI